MPIPVPIDGLAEELESLMDEVVVCLNRKTGEHIMLPVCDLSSVEEGCDDVSELEWPWAEEDLPKLRGIAEGDESWIHLPDKLDIHEWSIMESFALEAPSRHADQLREAIHGRGAFRRFHDALDRTGLRDLWYEYKHEHVVALVAQVLDEANVPYRRGRA
jgi:hypothetical protein